MIWYPICQWLAALFCSTLLALFVMSPAGAAPVIFAPGVISGPADDSGPAFTPDGKTVIFTRNDMLMISTRQANGWSAPVIAPFSGKWRDQQAVMAPDGSHLVFVSNRPHTNDGAAIKGGNIWRVGVRDGVWGEPVPLPASVNRTGSIWAPSIVADGSLYFIDRAGPGKSFRLWRSQYRDGAYEAAQAQTFFDHETKDVDPAVAPDESFIVFSSVVPGTAAAHERLYIAFRGAGGWSAPLDLGSDINGDGSADVNEARLSPDGRTLYFTTERASTPLYPRSAEQANADLARTELWDNGRQNIWSVSLASWLPVRERR